MMHNVKMRIAICDDDRSDADAIKESIEAASAPDTIRVYSNATELLKDYKSGARYDVIFLDIQMEGLNGFAAAERLRNDYAEERPLVILTTITTQYVVVGYKVAWRYIQKPVDGEVIKDILKQAQIQLSKQSLLIRAGSDYITLKVRDILYIEAFDKYLEVVAKTGKYETRVTLDEISEQLPGYRFARPHRSYLVNLAHVVRFQDRGTKEIVLTDEIKIPVSRLRSEEFRLALEDYLRGGFND